MELTATTLEEALTITAKRTSLGSGFPVYIIPWGLGNIPYNQFLCHEKTQVEKIWESWIIPVQNPTFRRAHIIHCAKPPGPK